jgi:hydroxyacylglutathione hydrolase
MSYAVADLSTGEANVLVFTGDALFVGDVGRTDLYGPEESLRLAAYLYDSIVNKLLPLGDGVILCPAHGAGSICGANIADRDESTLGLEKIQNPLLQMNRDEFIKYKVAEKLEKPHYFRQMEKYNLEGAPFLGSLPLPSPLLPSDFKDTMERGGMVIDTRYPAAFGGAHIKGAYSIWLEGLPVFAGWVLDYDKPILLVLEDQHHLEKAVRYLIRVGYDRIIGYLKGGVEGWYNAGFPVEHLPVLTVHEVKAKLNRREKLTILDVRSENEWNEGHIKGALHVYVGHIKEKMADVPKDKPVAIFCNVGRRAGLGASILLQEDYREVCNVLGGMSAWRAAGYPTSAG